MDTVGLYILILFLVTLTFMQGDRSARKRKLLRQLSYNLFNLFGWNLTSS